MYKFTLTSCQ